MSDTQKPVAWLIEFENGETELHFHDCNNSLGCKQTALYAAPVVATDVLKEAQRYRWLRDSEFEPEDQEFPAIVMLDDFGSCPIARGDMDATIDKYMAKYPGASE